MMLRTVRYMRVALPALVILAACRSVPVDQLPATSTATGAPTAHAAVDMYMTGMREGDFKLVGNIWGTRQTLAREHYSRAEFEKRVFVASCYLGWDGYRIASDRPIGEQSRMVTVRSTSAGQEREATLRVEESSSARWFVEGADLSGLTPVNCA